MAIFRAETVVTVCNEELWISSEFDEVTSLKLLPDALFNLIIRFVYAETFRWRVNIIADLIESRNLKVCKPKLL